MEQKSTNPERHPRIVSLLADGEELAVHLEEEMVAAQHEHARPQLVRDLMAMIETLEEVASQQVERMLLVSAERNELRVHSKEWRELARKRGFQLDSLTRKHIKRGAELGVLRGEVRRAQEQHARRVEELKGRSRTIKDLKRALTVSNANREALRGEVVQLRRRLRDSNLRKLTLAFNAGGMELEVGQRVAEPVNPATDAELKTVIWEAIRDSKVEWADGDTEQTYRDTITSGVLAALRSVR